MHTCAPLLRSRARRLMTALAATTLLAAAAACDSAPARPRCSGMPCSGLERTAIQVTALPIVIEPPGPWVNA